jgi:hypothetical protein
MLEKLTGWIGDPKNRDLALVAGGMIGIMTGAKVVPAAMFAIGARGIARRNINATPDLRGAGFRARWDRAIENYDAGHQNQVNRALHSIGIPMIVGGTVGLLAMPRYTPPWWVANGAFATGWALNFVGHALEKSPPAFATDPLSFLAGPVWDYVRLKDAIASAVRGKEAIVDRAPEAAAAADR